MSFRFRPFAELPVRYRIYSVLLTAIFCFALAIFAQLRLDRRLIDCSAFLLYSLAGVFFSLVFGGAALEQMQGPNAPARPETHTERSRSIRTVTILLGIALLGCLDFGANRFRPLGLILWLGGLCLCLCYLYLRDCPQRSGGWLNVVLTGRPIIIPQHLLPLGIVVLAGATLRLYKLDAIPADIGWDLPYNYFDVLSILRGEYRIFFPANRGREGLFFYLAALVAHLSPPSHFSLKLTSALVGIVTIPAVYLAARRLFDQQVALMAASLLAVNRWHIVLSRAGFRVILLPLFTILALYTAARALQSYRPFDFAFAGLVLGLGLYTYTSFLFTPLAIIAGFVLYGLSIRHRQWHSLLPSMLLMITVAVVAYAPLGRFAIEHPEEYLQRVTLQLQFLKSDQQRTPMSFLENLWASLLMYHVYGDGTSRFNVPFYRHLGFVSGILLVLGLSYTIRRWRHGNNSLLLTMFFLLVLPMTLAMFPHEKPNLFRSAGTIGSALILAALPLAAIAKSLSKLSAIYSKQELLLRLKISSMDQVHEFIWQLGRQKVLVLAPLLAALLLLMLEGRETAYFYFHDLVNVLPDRQNVSIAKEIARQIEAYGDKYSCYIKVWPHWFDGKALATYLRNEDMEWNPEFVNLVPDQPPLSSVTERAVFFLNPADSEALAVLSSSFTHHVAVPHMLPDGTPAFVVVYVER